MKSYTLLKQKYDIFINKQKKWNFLLNRIQTYRS
jgi:hypothetical protein